MPCVAMAHSTKYVLTCLTEGLNMHHHSSSISTWFRFWKSAIGCDLPENSGTVKRLQEAVLSGWNWEGCPVMPRVSKERRQVEAMQTALLKRVQWLRE